MDSIVIIGVLHNLILKAKCVIINARAWISSIVFSIVVFIPQPPAWKRDVTTA